MNASDAFEKLNRYLQDVKEWMSASKLKLNPDKTEFIHFSSKKQRERLNACFPIDILGNLFIPPSQSGTWVCGLTLIFPSLNMSRMLVKTALFN